MTQAPVITPLSTAATSIPPAPLETVIDMLHRSGHFKYLIAAIKATGLASPFGAAGPHTVFAPNDSAFGKLAKDVLAQLFDPLGKARLISVLRLHLVPRRVRAAVPGDAPSTLISLHGETLSMDTEAGLRVNSVRILERDLEASNGVIHVIDTVLMPRAS